MNAKEAVEQLDPLPHVWQPGYTELMKICGIKTTAAGEAFQVVLDAVKHLDANRASYGPHDMATYGMFGCVVRMTDEFEKLKVVFSNKRNRHRKMSDILQRIINHATIAILLEKRKWPKE